MGFDLYGSKNVKTRKDQKCFLCLEYIKKGTRCFYEKGKYDGVMFSRHSHYECSAAFNKINDTAQADESWIELYDSDGMFDFKTHLKMIKELYK